MALVEHLCCQRPGEGHQNDEAGKSLFGSERRISVPRCFGPLFPWLHSSPVLKSPSCPSVFLRVRLSLRALNSLYGVV